MTAGGQKISIYFTVSMNTDYTIILFELQFLLLMLRMMGDDDDRSGDDGDSNGGGVDDNKY